MTVIKQGKVVFENGKVVMAEGFHFSFAENECSLNRPAIEIAKEYIEQNYVFTGEVNKQ